MATGVSRRAAWTAGGRYHDRCAREPRTGFAVLLAIGASVTPARAMVGTWTGPGTEGTGFCQSRGLRVSRRSWTKPRRVIAKVEWILENFIRASGSLCEHEAERVVAFYNKRGTCEQSIQGRQRRDQVDAAVPPDVRRQRGAAPASRAPLQPRQFPAHVGDAGADQGLIADKLERQADQDRREGREPRPLCRLPDGRGRHPAAKVAHATAFASACLARRPEKRKYHAP
jgi:hypothetical protein